MTDQIFYLFSAVLLGLVVGALIMYFSTGANKDSDKTIAELEKKIKTYQNDVAEHFEKTADLVDDLTQSYKNVFDHLGKSARDLMTDDQIRQIERRQSNKVTLEFLKSEEEEQKQHEEEELDDLLTKTSERKTREDPVVTDPEVVTEDVSEGKSKASDSDDEYDENSYT